MTIIPILEGFLSNFGIFEVLRQIFSNNKNRIQNIYPSKGTRVFRFLKIFGIFFFLDFSDLLGRLLRFLDIFEIFCEVSELSFIFFHFYIFAGINDIYARKFFIYARKKRINDQ